MSSEPRPLDAWDRFVLRHRKPANLAVHFVSAVLFFGSPVYGVWKHDWRAIVVFCLSGCIGSLSHYLFRDGTVSLHEATSSPHVVGANVRMWWRIALGRYDDDIAAARIRLAAMQEAQGRTVLVTGTSTGFGRAMIGVFLARGFRVIATVRTDAQRSELRAFYAKDAARLRIVAGDLATADARDRIVATARAEGRLDALVCNAGVGIFGALEDLGEGDLRRSFEVNAVAPALLARDLVPLLRATGGTIVNVSSPAGVAGFPWTSAYAASKHALEGLTESLFYELRPTGVRVHLVTPSAHRTAFVRHAQWRIAGASPHARGVAAYRAALERNQAKSLPSASEVADAVADAVEYRGYPMRIDVGGNVRVLRAMVRFLPAFVRHAIVLAVFARATSREAPAAPVALPRS